MRIAVTGAGGFIGLNLVRKLSDEGHQVLAIDRGFGVGAEGLLGKMDRVRFVRADVLNAGNVRGALEGFRPEALFHGATLTADLAREKSDFADILEVNIVGTGRVLDAALRAGVGRVVLASSSAVYGDCVFDGPPREDSVATPSTLYGITKMAAEQAALRFSSINGLDVRIARIAAVFGPFEHRSGARDVMSPLFQIAAKALSGTPASLPEGGARDWIGVTRVADILAALIQKPDLGYRVYNVAARQTWLPSTFAARLADAVGQGWQWESGAERPNIDYRDNLERRRYALDTTRIRRELGEAILGETGTDATDYARWAIDNPAWFQ